MQQESSRNFWSGLRNGLKWSGLVSEDWSGVQVAESGLDFVIVRAGKSDGVDPSLLESGVSVTPQGSLTNNAQVTKSQVSCQAHMCHLLLDLPRGHKSRSLRNDKSKIVSHQQHACIQATKAS